MFCQCKSLSSPRNRFSIKLKESFILSTWKVASPCSLFEPILKLKAAWIQPILKLKQNMISTRKYFHPKFDSLQSWVHEKWRKRLSVGILLIWHLFYLSLPVQNCGGPDSFSLRLIVCMSSYAGNCTANRGTINLHLGPQSGRHTPRLWLFWIRCKSMRVSLFLWIT